VLPKQIRFNALAALECVAAPVFKGDSGGAIPGKGLPWIFVGPNVSTRPHRGFILGLRSGDVPIPPRLRALGLSCI
jgi:hypothetical protein